MIAIPTRTGLEPLTTPGAGRVDSRRVEERRDSRGQAHRQERLSEAGRRLVGRQDRAPGPASVQGAKKVASDSLGIHLMFNTPLLLNPTGSLQ